VAAPLTVVVGAGISGLACAYALKKSGANVLVLEASVRPGGVIQSVREDGFLFELGPQSFSGSDRLFALCDELNISDQLLEAPRRAPRYILVAGKLVEVPLSPRAFVTSPLLSWRTKWSLLADLFRTTRPPETDETVASFVRSRFTPELLDRLVGPFVSGIYAGDPEELSLRAAFPKIHEAEKLSGSIIRGSFRLAKNTKPQTRRSKGLFTFQQGNETLVKALAAALGDSLSCNTEVVAEIQCDRGQFLLETEAGNVRAPVRAEKLVLATASGVNANLLRQIAPAATWPLSEIEYAPVAVVSHGYRSVQIGRDLRGFGFLIPRSANLQTLGTVWNSSLFPGRAPADQVVITSFIGGARKPQTHHMAPKESAELVRREVGQILAIQGEPTAERITDYWAAIPQYNFGHTRRLKTIRASAERAPGLFLVGSYWNGPAIGACIEHAFAVAEQVRIGYGT
jgi:oxygen-dependent protoporphyrinogen oxidase